MLVFVNKLRSFLWRILFHDKNRFRYGMSLVDLISISSYRIKSIGNGSIFTALQEWISDFLVNPNHSLFYHAYKLVKLFNWKNIVFHKSSCGSYVLLLKSYHSSITESMFVQSWQRLHFCFWDICLKSYVFILNFKLLLI